MNRAGICAALVLAATAALAGEESEVAATSAANVQPASTPSTPATTPAGAVAVSTAATTPAGAVAVNDFPSLPNDPALGAAMRGTPASLPPVSAQIFRIGGKIEFQPVVQFSIGDPFYRSILAGVRLERHLDERWSVSGHVLGGTSLLSAPVDVCTDSSCTSPEAGQLRSTPGDIRMMGGFEVGWAPIYGKLSLAGEKTIHFDAYLSAGPEVLLERIAPDAASPAASRLAFGGRVGIGERIFFSNDFLLRLGVSELLYAGRIRGSTELERKLSVEIGVAWLFGGR
ncbi:MAG TPA: outer membrane beta-barrel domain-containing protein [Myxococcales bacterium]|nr:outer membrane beta-barrel domain-containing protein [Myxococcales bacterium]